MFKALIEIFRKEDLLQISYDSCIKMLKSDQEMFEAAWKSLRKSDTGEMAIDIYKKDAEINEFERDIRRKVLAHLTTSPTKDIVFGLILISIVIDIERIGDYTKNIVELAQNHPKKLHGNKFEQDLLNLESKTSARFTNVIEAFEKSEVEIARNVMHNHREISKLCDAILHRILEGELDDIPSNHAVAMGLYLRYLKRINSHITNIASGIVNPFDRIGFKE